MPAPAFVFKAQGVTVNVFANEVADGVEFWFDTILEPGWKIDLNGFFLDLGGDGGPIRSVGASSVNMNGGNNDGYDKALFLGAVGGRESLDFRDGYGGTILGIDLEDLAGADAGLRATSYGYNSRGGSLKLVNEEYAPAIMIEKLTNGEDGLIVYDLGTDIVWSYEVTNTGNVELQNVKVVDDNGTPLNLLDDWEVGTIASLAVGQSVTLYVAGGDAGDIDDDNPRDGYWNEATATGDGYVPDVGIIGTVEDSDISSFVWGFVDA